MIWKTPTYADYNWTIRPDVEATFGAGFTGRVQKALVDLDDPALLSALLRDMLRVCRPGARLVVLNHFSPRNPFLAAVERWFSPVTSALLGFQADFPLEPIFEQAAIEIDDVRRATPVGSWYAVTFTRKDLA